MGAGAAGLSDSHALQKPAEDEALVLAAALGQFDVEGALLAVEGAQQHRLAGRLAQPEEGADGFDRLVADPAVDVQVGVVPSLPVEDIQRRLQEFAGDADAAVDASVEYLLGDGARQHGDGVELLALQAEQRDIEARIRKLTALLEDAEMPGPLLRRLDELEKERETTSQRLARVEEETRRAKALAAIKESDVRRMLDALAEDMAELDRAALKDFLGGFIEKIVLDPATRAGSIRYRVGASGVKVASPRGTGDNPILQGSVPFQAPRNRKAA